MTERLAGAPRVSSAERGGAILWLEGADGPTRQRLAERLRRLLERAGVPCELVDEAAPALRSQLTPSALSQRLAALLARQGTVAICADASLPEEREGLTVVSVDRLVAGGVHDAPDTLLIAMLHARLPDLGPLLTANAVPLQPAADPLSPTEQRQLEERLRALGYLD